MDDLNNVTLVTEKGLKELKERLEYLKTIERDNVRKLIGEAKSYGDLSENSEYDAAKNREAEVEMEIMTIQEKLKNVKIISEDDIDISNVSLGCRVRLFDKEFNEEVTYKIMGEEESDPLNFIISNTSPVGQAIMGKHVGDEVDVNVPDGIVKLKILEIMQ